jgi:uncharacterized membrane protein
MRRARVNTAALLFGIGFGGLLYAIVLRGLVRWQQTLPADGWFDFFLFLVTAVGVVFLFSAFRAPGRMPSGRAFAGCLLIGWGAFNLAYGIVVQLTLGLHHVHEMPAYAEVYDWAFLALGALLVIFGLSLRDLRDPEAIRDRRSGVDRRLVSMLDQ